MRRRALGGATLKSISDDVPILKQLKMIEEYEQASAPDIQLVDNDGNVVLTIYAGAHPVKVKRLGPDMVFDWTPALAADAQ